jgi:putative heme-binding domain-containing protein
MNMLVLALLLAQAAPAQQIERGEALYMDAEKGCATCHALKGKGTAVGPDLTGIGRLSPQAVAMAARSTVGQYVQTIKTKTSGNFSVAMPGPKNGDTVQFYDLTKNPPELHKVPKDEISSMTNTDSWKHPPVANKITTEALADLVAYIRYASTGQKKTVTPDEVK